MTFLWLNVNCFLTDVEIAVLETVFGKREKENKNSVLYLQLEIKNLLQLFYSRNVAYLGGVDASKC